MQRYCVVSVCSEIHAVHISTECYLSCTSVVYARTETFLVLT